MADGRGGKRPNSGRPSAYEEGQAKRLSREAMVIEFGSELNFFKHLAEKAKGGSFQHLKLLAAYGYGQPSEKIEVQADGEFTVLRKVV